MADAPTFRKEQTGNPALDRIQAVVSDLIVALRTIPILWNGKLVSVVFAGGVRKVVRHGLGVAAACIVVRQNYDLTSVTYGRLLEFQNDGVDLTKNLALISDINATYDLWFYPRSSKPIDSAQGQSL